MRIARALGAIGRTCIAAGVLILLFVAYQLWGTGIREAQAQNRLEDQFTQALEELDQHEGRAPTTPTTATTTPPPPEPVADGDAIARVKIPKIGVDKIVVEGVSVRNLKKGPGHYPETPLPGQLGNVAIAGHRTTYGAPFNRIDELAPGDEILVETVQGAFIYEVSEQLIVTPKQVEVLGDKGDARLTLTSCHPEYSSRQRIVVVAHLVTDDEPLPSSTPPDRAPSAIDDIDDIDGEGGTTSLAIGLAMLSAVIWLLAWLLGRRWRKWPAYAVGLPFFLVALFYFFEEFSRFLPSNF